MNRTDAKILKTGSKFWKKSHDLEWMTFKEWVVVYFQYYTILTYPMLAAVMIGLYIGKPALLVPALGSIGLAVLGLSLVWYRTRHCVWHLCYNFPRKGWL